MPYRENERIGRREQVGDPLTINDLLQIMAALRTPITGCPWDLQQDFRTIAPYTIEEAYEVADAIERRDYKSLMEELGDLLFQVVYHARMAEEEETFDFADVVDAIARKMIRRHPHVFGDEMVRASFELDGFWERMKAEEKQSQGQESVLSHVATTLPALTRAYKLQSKAAKAGFDWPDVQLVLKKISEELSELRTEINSGGDMERLNEEFGDLLFVMANLARHLKIDPEASLRSANEKFTRRFQRVETLLAEQDKTPEDSNLEEMDALWDHVKAEERMGRSKR